ncbi:MAG: bifunctional UDP-N-acetylglucosamine diphosphorylase/glucosamine-1-phosphate N-acetyltransferase GlmU [Paracoccaceae bacterium]|nr:bifunctional UDP-N-acetylglucosamine diphosphorylase/glucosamine-1-phosphate N-acetyltransferase GlmU [Paracoccaceae bacterium]
MASNFIILAAGQGSRMNSDLPKVLHKLAGVPLLAHAMNSAALGGAEKSVVVTGHGGAAVAKAALGIDADTLIANQDEQLGTAHAVLQAKDALGEMEGDCIVLYGDTPFISPETLEEMSKARDSHDVLVLGFETNEPGRYGRLITNGDKLDRVIEAKDASPEELSVTLCNSGVICANTSVLFDLLSEVKDNNAANEYYLTDIIGIATSKGLSCGVVHCDIAETLGINTRAELAAAEADFQAKARIAAMENGVSLTAPETVYFAYDTVIGRDTTIEPNVFFGPGVTIENDVEIKANCHFEGCHISRGSVVGPFARLRIGAELAEDVRVGNFVEIKNADLAEGAKVNHLSYVGDATVGKAANIGAGTITCNYDGVVKHRTEIGARAFIGSNTSLVAPVSIGIEAMTASGSVITQNVPIGALALSRAKQVNKDDLATRLMDKLRATKARKEKEKKDN